MKIKKNKHGKYIIDFTCKGKRIIRVIGENKREAEEAMAFMKADILREKYGFPRPQKNAYFEDFAKEFLELYSKKNKKSWRRDSISLDNLKAVFKGILLSEITPDLIEKYKAKRSDKVSAATTNREIACLKTLFNKAVEWKRLESNPSRQVKLLREQNIKERILADDEAKRLVEIAGKRLKPVLIVALNTGMRKGEILSLKWKQIDFDNHVIKIEDSKSGKPRKVPMNHLVVEAIKDLPKGKSELVFFNPKTRAYIKDVKTAFRKACYKSSIKGLRFHDLRHTAASKMIEAGVDLATVSKILGHSSIQTTMRYVHSTEDNMKRAVDKLAEIFDEPRKKAVISEKERLADNRVISLYSYN